VLLGGEPTQARACVSPDRATLRPVGGEGVDAVLTATALAARGGAALNRRRPRRDESIDPGIVGCPENSRGAHAIARANSSRAAGRGGCRRRAEDTRKGPPRGRDERPPGDPASTRASVDVWCDRYKTCGVQRCGGESSRRSPQVIRKQINRSQPGLRKTRADPRVLAACDGAPSRRVRLFFTQLNGPVCIDSNHPGGLGATRAGTGLRGSAGEALPQGIKPHQDGGRAVSLVHIRPPAGHGYRKAAAVWARTRTGLALRPKADQVEWHAPRGCSTPGHGDVVEAPVVGWEAPKPWKPSRTVRDLGLGRVPGERCGGDGRESPALRIRSNGHRSMDNRFDGQTRARSGGRCVRIHPRVRSLGSENMGSSLFARKRAPSPLFRPGLRLTVPLSVPLRAAGSGALAEGNAQRRSAAKISPAAQQRGPGPWRWVALTS